MWDNQIDINDVIKEIIYRSADDCNYNNVEINFPSILKYFYDVINRYNIKKNTSDEIFNKLLIICKNIIEEKIKYEYSKPILDNGSRLYFNPYFQNDENTNEQVFNSENKEILETYNIYKQRNSNNVDNYFGDIKDDYLRNVECSPYSINNEFYNEKNNNFVKFTKLCKKENEYNILNEDSKTEQVSIIPHVMKNDEKKKKYYCKNINELTNVNQISDINSIHNEYRENCWKYFGSNTNEIENFYLIKINEKSFLHTNNRNLLKIYLNGETIHNIYKKLTKYRHNNNEDFYINKKNKMKIYNEANLFFTYIMLKKMFILWMNFVNKKKLINKNKIIFNKICNKKVLIKYYDIWIYRFEKKIYLKHTYERLILKNESMNIRKYFNKWLNKYKKKRKINFIYCLHIFSEWKNFAEKSRLLQLSTNKLGKKKKKKIFTIWKNKYQNKIIKKIKNKEIYNIYNKNLLIKCYVHLVLYYKKRKHENECYQAIYLRWRINVCKKYFYFFIQIYNEELEFKEYYQKYINKIKTVLIKKYFSSLYKYSKKCKKLSISLAKWENRKKKNIPYIYFLQWINIYNENLTIINILKCINEKKKIYILKKYFTILKKHKEKTFYSKKLFIYIYEKKNKQDMEKIYNQWKNYYILNSSKYIFLYNKYKYKIMIQSFYLLYKYKEYKKKRKAHILTIDNYFVNNLKKNVIKKWIMHIKVYRKNILSYYNFNNESNLVLLFMSKIMIKHKILSKSVNNITILDFVNFNNIDININSLIYAHKKYYSCKNIMQNPSYFYQNVSFILKSINIVLSFVPASFIINLSKLKFSLPYFSFALKMALYKIIFTNWLLNCRSIKIFKKKIQENILKRYFLSLFLFGKKKKKLAKLKMEYEIEQEDMLKKKIFIKWLGLRIKYFKFRKKIDIYIYKTKENRMKKVLIGWYKITKGSNKKKENILNFFKKLLIKKKRKCFNSLIINVKRTKEIKVKKEISDLFYMNKLKKISFKSLFVYSKNMLYFNTLNKMAQNYLKGLCIIKWRKLTRQYINKKEKNTNILNYFYLKIKKKFFNILIVYTNLRQINKKKISHFKKIQEKIFFYKYMRNWKNYVEIKKNKKEFMEKIVNHFSRKKKINVLSKWYTTFIINIKFKEADFIFTTKIIIIYFNKLFLYAQKMKRILMFIKNRQNILTCQRILKQWKGYTKRENKRKIFYEKICKKKKEEYYILWCKMYEKVRKKKNQGYILYKIRQINNLNKLYKFYTEWKVKYIQNKQIKSFIYIMNKCVIDKIKLRTFNLLYKNYEYHLNISSLFNNFLLEKRNKIKKYIFNLLVYNKNRRIKNRTALYFYVKKIKTKAFHSFKKYKNKKLLYEKNTNILINRKKKLYFYTIINFYNIIHKIKSNYFELCKSIDTRIKRYFFIKWFIFLRKKKMEKQNFIEFVKKRENKKKEEIFLEIFRKSNKKKYIAIILKRVNHIFQTKMYQMGIYKLRVNRKYMIIQEKIYKKLAEKQKIKIMRKCVKVLQKKVAKQKRKETEQDMITFFYNNFIKKIYFKKMINISTQLLKYENNIMEKIKLNNYFYCKRSHFIKWKLFVEKKKKYKKMENLIKLKKMARIFFVFLYVRAKTSYKQILIMYKIFILFNSTSKEVDTTSQLLDFGYSLFSNVYIFKDNIEHNVRRNATSNSSGSKYTFQNNSTICSNVTSDLVIDVEPKPAEPILLNYCKSEEKEIIQQNESFSNNIMIKKKNRNLFFKNIKKYLGLNTIYSEMKKKDNLNINGNKIKIKNDYFANFLNVCNFLKNNNINRLILNYLMLYDIYDINIFFIHYKKKFKSLYNYFFNLLSIKMKKALLKIFKKNDSYYYIKLINSKEKQIQDNLKILLFIYYLFNSASFPFYENNSSLYNIQNIWLIINDLFKNSKNKQNYNDKNNNMGIGNSDNLSVINGFYDKKRDYHYNNIENKYVEFIGRNSNSSSDCNSDYNINYDNNYFTFDKYEYVDEHTNFRVKNGMNMYRNEKSIQNMNCTEIINKDGILTMQTKRKYNLITIENYENKMMYLYNRLQGSILNRFRESEMIIKYSFLLNLKISKLIQVYLFFKKMKNWLNVWNKYSLSKKEKRDSDLNKIGNFKKRINTENLEKYFGTWILLFNTKVKEMKNQRKAILKKHIQLIFIFWHKLIIVNNYDKDKFLELKNESEKKLKFAYFINYYNFFKKRKNEKVYYEIVLNHTNNKKKQTFFYVWLLLYKYEKKCHSLIEKKNYILLQYFFYNWVSIYEKKLIYMNFINEIKKIILKKNIFKDVIRNFRYFNFIKLKKDMLQKKYFQIYYNLIKKNSIINKLQIYIYSSLQYKRMKHLFFYWNRKFNTRKKCLENYYTHLSKKKHSIFTKWKNIFTKNKNINDEKLTKFNKLIMSIYLQKLIIYCRYRKVKKRVREKIMNKYFFQLKKKYEQSSQIKAYINKYKLNVKKNVFSALNRYKILRKHNNNLKKYCTEYNRKGVLKKYYKVWIMQYFKLKKINNCVKELLIQNDILMKTTIINNWINYAKKKATLQNYYHIVISKKYKIIKNNVFYKWRYMHTFFSKQRHKILGEKFNIWMRNFKFVIFMNKIQIHFYNIYQYNISSFYYILKKKNENYKLLQNGYFPFVKNQIKEIIDYKGRFMRTLFYAINSYTNKRKKLRLLLASSIEKLIKKRKSQCFSILLKHKNISQKKVHLHNLYLKYTIEKKFYLFKKYFFIIINLYFYNNHLRLCQQTIKCRKRQRVLSDFLTQWKIYKEYSKEKAALKMLSNNFLAYRRKTEFIVALKQYCIENKWKNYCEYNSLMFYKKVKEKMVAQFLVHWKNKALCHFNKIKKIEDFKNKCNINVMKKYFFILIFSINKVKIEKKNFDIVRFKNEKNIKQYIFNILYNTALTNINNYEQVIQIAIEKKKNYILKCVFLFLHSYTLTRKKINNIFIKVKQNNTTILLKKYFYNLIFKYVININHHKYYYYNKYLSIWKYYVVIQKREQNEVCKSGQEEELETNEDNYYNNSSEDNINEESEKLSGDDISELDQIN
ncbi:conserved Plasmodium protein, unknown function [Plasmodium berghei]|uniref:Uncharacterized protein n=2 Tax=Plasmodium berghei TaxID=5821 RepID=A0A509AQU5_PLABA|nr:conserved Plasmodium protein, unknown function [Plasmodium berghei ANKA]CXI77498.1 conserved Plasmodium protein, unknown function [Plasmodium berghei]SCM25054.1 conserved Plasmodium protein, unknown function [Plasmodium berghei]SCN27248.1 conserved Plasmodium protein, unknown function [Plasmodium berghei]SCO61839.1 conserved Plasmodium protein, unknown function [Plasmodium berghei]SCO63674.1 conserved Plasmodium protein, unknown function [Plasmodium berghei]|eukprot:XP_034422884.1 conserved Plasmodium protein, unknown function [Plasmodium berghei ANKA]